MEEYEKTKRSRRTGRTGSRRGEKRSRGISRAGDRQTDLHRYAFYGAARCCTEKERAARPIYIEGGTRNGSPKAPKAGSNK